ncbi:uncharacterized protein LOC125070673 [Vanessa atalanta]|uniref:uncharacterized protein LOC125070673 n=1 Tax=Vanessa atalanta TaxID=42275 RepID=UPI000E7755BF|nr:uncharacterized protein LOC113401035 [Vanessa tameamea]XP_047536578.1 uncharacterized protein LOC125070673 [Vanessa atalanta]
MQAAPARYVSASELYSTDEVELLLEEIRELEPTSCRGEDVQDFEIAGSGCAGAGGRSPAGTELTERSWDSHAHYSRAPPPRPRALAPVYCHLSYLITPTGGLTFLLVLCSLCVCICVWGALGLRAASAAKPLLFGALTSFMLHTVLMLMHISLLDALLPVDWNRFSGVSFAWSASWLTGGAVALLVALPSPAAHSTVASMLYTAAGCALGGAGVALLGAGVCVRGGCVRAGRAGLRAARSGSLRAAYRAVPQASTSRDRAL